MRLRNQRECQKAMRDAQDIADDAADKIAALAKAHYDACKVCQALAAKSQIERLQYDARERIECGGIY